MDSKKNTALQKLAFFSPPQSPQGAHGSSLRVTVTLQRMADSKGAGTGGAAVPSADSQSAEIMDFGRISGHMAGQEELTRGH